MSKDPAFLFYAKDFYEGTRMMLPEERACYIDLLIYQHQNGPIPRDFRRLTMYCSGVSVETLESTLKEKFILTDSGWVNERLLKTIKEREDFSKKQSINGKVGQFWKKLKAEKSHLEYKDIRNNAYKLLDNNEILKIIEPHEGMLEAMLKALLKHLADANEDANAIEDKNSTKVGKSDKVKQIPTLDSFLEYAMANDPHYHLKEPNIILKYKSWVENNWRTADKSNKPIVNWKNTLLNTLPYIKKEESESAARSLIDQLRPQINPAA